MNKILLISLAILSYPILRFRYRKAYNTCAFAARKRIHLLQQNLKKIPRFIGVLRQQNTSPFMHVFMEHFHQRSGKFRDVTLRKKVYAELHNKLKSSTNYQAQYRKMDAVLQNGGDTQSSLNQEERLFVLKYFQTHFTHPNQL